MRLVRLSVRGFQCHGMRELVFSPGITTICGPTDSGKSALMRALRWVALGDLRVGGLVKKGADAAEVSLVFQDEEGEQHEVRRIKSSDGTVNTCWLDGLEFRSFGTELPDEVKRALGLTGLNFQDQHDAPFWFSSTGGEVSRELNSIVDLSLVDDALKNVAGFLRKASEETKLVEERTREIEVELAGLAEVEEKAADFEVVKAAQKTAIQIQYTLSNLRATLCKVDEASASLRWLETKASEERALLGLAEKALSLITEHDKLASLLSQTEEARAKVASAPPDFSQVEMVYGVWKSTFEKVERLARLVESVATAKSIASDAAKAAEAARAKFSSETKGALCPLCGNPIQ